MSDERLIIKEDITDWREETLRDELIIESDEDIFKAFDDGVHASKIARAVIVSREMEAAPFNIIPANRALLECGSHAAIAGKMNRRRAKEVLPNGNTIEVGEYLGRGNIVIQIIDDDNNVTDNVTNLESVETGPSYSKAKSDDTLRNSLRYLNNYIPGYIRNQLAYVAINGGNVTEEADKLKKTIDEIVSQLV